MSVAARRGGKRGGLRSVMRTLGRVMQGDEQKAFTRLLPSLKQVDWPNRRM
jgi:hypothetical protein